MMAANGGSRKLSRNQEKAVVALLSSRTISDAASSAGVGERTLERWLSEDPEFVEEYRAARRLVVEASIGRLQEATSEAVDALKDNLSCGKSAVEVRAALGILEHAVKAVEIYDLESRLQALERSESG